MHGTRPFRVEGKVELLVPIEEEAGVGEGVVAVAGSGAVAGDIGGVGGNLVGDDALAHVVLIRQSEVFLGRDVAEHGGAVPADHGGADGGSDVIVAGRDVGDQRAQRVEGRFVAHLDFLIHLKLDLVQRDVPGAFDHHLHVVLPGLLGELAQGLQFGELRLVAGVRQASRAQPVAQREGDVVFLEDFADVLEVRVEKVLLVIFHTPLGQDGAAAADDAGDALASQGNILAQHAGMDGHVIHALRRLLFDHLQHDLGSQIAHARHARKGFVDGHRADRNGAVAQNRFANVVDVAARREVHGRIGAEMHGGVELFQFLLDVGGGGGVADVGVDFALRRNANGHGLELEVADVGGNDHAAARHFVSDRFRRQALALGHILHLLRHVPWRA